MHKEPNLTFVWKGQPRVIIRRNLEFFEYQMLHTKFLIGWSILEKGFKGITTYGHGGHLGHVTLPISINLSPLVPEAEGEVGVP